MGSSDFNEKLYMNVCSERTLQSDKNGFFLQFCNHVILSVGADWLNETFAHVKTDKDRIKIIFTDPAIKDIVCDTLKNVDCVYRKKDASFSRDKRLDGDMFLSTGKLTKALIFYCQSVLRAPEKGVNLMVDAGRSLSLALWHRSRALIELGLVCQALSDIQLALKEGLPDKFKPELYLRMALCYQAQAEHARAKVAFSLSEKLYGNNSKGYQETRNNLKVGTQARTKFKRVLPEITDQHPEFEYASSGLKVEETDTSGRYMVAKESISTGSVLMVEPPHTACLLPECSGSHCHHCFQRLVAPIGCPECSGLAFCSTDCRDKALSTYHKYECKLLDLMIGSGMSILCHVALRMITKVGVEKSLDIYKNQENERVYELCSHVNKRDTKDFLQRTLMAAFLLRCLQKCGFFSDKNENSEITLTETELVIGELLLKNLQLLQFNAHEIFETRCSPQHTFKESKIAFIAIGVYPTAAILNHECYPAVMRYFVGSHIVMRALRPLKPGEVVAENYGPIFLRKTLEERQRSLISRYWFKCECQCCKEDWKDSDCTIRLRCPTENCNNLFMEPKQENIFCSKCKQNVSLKNSLDVIANCEKIYKEGLQCLDSQVIDDIVPHLKKAIDDFHRVASPPHHNTHMAQETLRSIYSTTGNIYDCLVPKQSNANV